VAAVQLRGRGEGPALSPACGAVVQWAICRLPGAPAECLCYMVRMAAAMNRNMFTRVWHPRGEGEGDTPTGAARGKAGEQQRDAMLLRRGPLLGLGRARRS
jgi:hypothetical protein